ncbi:hypothetical protein K7432_004586 [Basidiobolus ranarum]|uniref:C3H1-type domain-containing protein n=1 Tax=Basidiobolus ranarum TaxID=34480 RepID=A0ABR2W4G3_9FUNG
MYSVGCISIWRREGHIRNLSGLKRRRLCPVCRTYSELVIETPVYVTHGQKKDELIKEHVYKISQTPCQYFIKSPRNNRHCPFGDSCYFQHLEENGSVYSFSVRARNRVRKFSAYERNFAIARPAAQNISGNVTTRQEDNSFLTSLANFFSFAQDSSTSHVEDNISRHDDDLEELYLRENVTFDVQSLESPDANMIFLMNADV